MAIFLIISLMLIVAGLVMCYRNQYKLAYFIFKIRILDKNLDEYEDKEKEEISAVIGLYTILIGVLLGLGYLISSCVNCFYIMTLLVPLIMLIHIRVKKNIKKILIEIKNEK